MKKLQVWRRRTALHTVAVSILAAGLMFSGCAKEETSAVIQDELTANAAVEEQKEILTGLALAKVNDGYMQEVIRDYEHQEAVAAAEREALERANNPYYDIMADETGRVPIIMFHNFVPEYKEGGDVKITTTLAEFRKLLERFYNEGYRSTSLDKFIKGEIDVPKGCKAVIFTFDDGRDTQYSMIENPDGTLSDNPNTAVAVLEQFYAEYPDFGLNGTFFLNMEFAGTFGTVGTLKERCQAMLDKGFELENHSYSHANLAVLGSAGSVAAEIGRNAKEFEDMFPGHKMTKLALPFGNTSKSYPEPVVAGNYEGYDYRNIGVMLVGAEPAKQMYLKDADPVKIRRILASGITPVECDMGWWLDNNMGGIPEYISDGNPDTISVPKEKLDLVDEEKIKALGKELVVVEPEPEPEQIPEQDPPDTPVDGSFDVNVEVKEQ